MPFVIPSDDQLVRLYKAAAEIIREETGDDPATSADDKIPSDEEAVAFIAHYGMVARLTLGSVMSLVGRFKSKPKPATATVAPPATPPTTPTP